MSSDWTREYTVLTGFISEHPEIKITKGMVRVPSNVREQFYALFNNTRKAVVSECLPESLEESRNLIRSYRDAETKALKLLNLHSINSQATVQRFLDNVDDWLARELLDPLFNLLNGSITKQQFENEYTGIVASLVPPMYEKAYGRWLAVSLISLLEADELMTIPLPKLHPRDRAAVGGKDIFESLRPPQKSDKIEFQHELFQLFTTPDYIMHSQKLNRYVSIRTQYEDSLGAADLLPPAREWILVNAMGDVTSGMMLLYVADNPMEIAAVADRLKICRPDMIIECRTQKNWPLKEKFENIKLHNQSLSPACGTYIMSSTELSEADRQELGSVFSIVPAGVSENNLGIIIEALKNTAGKLEQNRVS